MFVIQAFSRFWPEAPSCTVCKTSPERYLSFPSGGTWVLLVTPRLAVICLMALSAELTYLLGGMWSPMTRPILVPQWWQPSLHACQPTSALSMCSSKQCMHSLLSLR